MANHKSFSLHRKSVAIFLTIFLLLLESPPFAMPSLSVAKMSDPSSDGEEGMAISIPEELGRIEESLIGNSGKTIIYIQDAHDSLEAQENIAKIIKYLVEHYGIKTVFEEGYEGEVPTDEYFGFIKEPEIKEKVSYFLMDKLRLGGAEYAHINRTKDFKLIGADSIKLHLQNIRWYRKNAKYQEETQRDLNALQKEIDRLVNLHFPKELKEWMKLKKRFDEKQIDLLEYLKRTLSLRGNDTSKAKATPYPNIALLLQAENAGDKTILDEVKPIDAKALFQEISRLEDDFADLFLTNEKDRTIFHFHKSLSLLRRLNNIELSSPEYETIKDTLQSFNTEVLAQFLVDQTKKSVVLSKHWEENIRQAMKFYEIATARDHAIEIHLDEFLKSNERIGVLVFGGFHEDRIKEMLKKKDVSHLVVSPKIVDIDKPHKELYQRLMAQGYVLCPIAANVTQASARLAGELELATVGGQKAIAELRTYHQALSHIINQLIQDPPYIQNTSRNLFHRTVEARLQKAVPRSDTRAKRKKLNLLERRSELRAAPTETTGDIGNRMNNYRDDLKHIGLTSQEIESLENYVRAFLYAPSHIPYIEQNFEEIMHSLASPERLSIALRPKWRPTSNKREDRLPWLDEIAGPFAKFHNDFLNQMPREMIVKLYAIKWLRGEREKNLRDFLSRILSRLANLNDEEWKFLQALDSETPLPNQGVEIVDLRDYSSARFNDEGAIVYEITLKKGNLSIPVFLKGFGKDMMPWDWNVGRHLDLGRNEIFAHQLAELTGLNALKAELYFDSQDSKMLSYILMEKIEGINSNLLFDLNENASFKLKEEYLPLQKTLISDLAKFAALSDMLRKTDRRLIQNNWPQFEANHLFDSTNGKIYALDHSYYFSTNNSVLQDLENWGSSEMGILIALPDFFTSPQAREMLFQIYKQAYLDQWGAMLAKRAEIEKLAARLFGAESLELQMIRQNMEESSEKNFEDQKAALMRYVAAVESERSEVRNIKDWMVQVIEDKRKFNELGGKVEAYSKLYGANQRINLFRLMAIDLLHKKDDIPAVFVAYDQNQLIGLSLLGKEPLDYSVRFGNKDFQMFFDAGEHTMDGNIAVIPPYRGRGVATSIMSESFDYLRKANLPSVRFYYGLIDSWNEASFRATHRAASKLGLPMWWIDETIYGLEPATGIWHQLKQNMVLIDLFSEEVHTPQVEKALKTFQLLPENTEEAWHLLEHKRSEVRNLDKLIAQAKQIDSQYSWFLKIKIERLLKDIIEKKIIPEPELGKIIEDKGHGFEHLLNAVSMALDLAQAEPSSQSINYDILALGAFFHDIYSAIDRKHHEEEGAKLAIRILEQLDYPSLYPSVNLQNVAQLVREHDFVEFPETTPLEVLIVRDADTLIEATDLDRIIDVSINQFRRKFFNPGLTLEHRLKVLRAEGPEKRRIVEDPINDALMFLLRNVTTGLDSHYYVTKGAQKFIQERNLMEKNRIKILEFAEQYDAPNKDQIILVIDEVIKAYRAKTNIARAEVRVFENTDSFKVLIQNVQSLLPEIKLALEKNLEDEKLKTLKARLLRHANTLKGYSELSSDLMAPRGDDKEYFVLLMEILFFYSSSLSAEGNPFLIEPLKGAAESLLKLDFETMRRSEVRQIAPQPSQLSISTSKVNLPAMIAKSQEIPSSLFFAYDEIKEKGSSLWKGLFALASRTQGSKLKLIIYNADRTDLGLNDFRELGVEMTQDGLSEAFGTFGEKSNGRNVNVSTKADLLRKELDLLSGLRLKHLLVQDESEIWAAYLRAITDPDQVIPGMDDSQGYYQVVGEFLRSRLRHYQESLVIAMAA